MTKQQCEVCSHWKLGRELRKGKQGTIYEGKTICKDCYNYSYKRPSVSAPVPDVNGMEVDAEAEVSLHDDMEVEVCSQFLQLLQNVMYSDNSIAFGLKSAGFPCPFSTKFCTELSFTGC